jgi:hypothetical protein
MPGDGARALTYVYCIAQSPEEPSRRGVPRGLPSTGPVRFLPVGRDLWLTAASAPPEKYDAARIERSLEDLKWVSRCAVAHEAVVEHVASRATVVPLKLFTLYRSDDRAAADVRRNRVKIQRALGRIGGCEEWGVRMWREERKRPAPPRVQRPASGASFLQQKSALKSAARQALADAQNDASEVFTRLAGLARDARRRDRETLIAGPQVLLDAAYLVPHGDARQFRSEARKLARRLSRRGHRLSVTGPWPPYNFIEESTSA